MDSVQSFLPYAISGLLAAASAYYVYSRKSELAFGLTDKNLLLTYQLSCRGCRARPQSLQEVQAH